MSSYAIPTGNHIPP